MSNAQSEHVTHDKENSNPDAASSRQRERPKDAADDPHEQAGLVLLADNSRGSETRAACGEKRREEKRERNEAAAKLADENRARKAKHDEDQRKDRQAAGKLADQKRALQLANAEPKRRPEFAAKEALRRLKIAAHEQREQQVCVAFCLPCGTGTVLALAALVCVS